MDVGAPYSLDFILSQSLQGGCLRASVIYVLPFANINAVKRLLGSKFVKLPSRNARRMSSCMYPNSEIKHAVLAAPRKNPIFIMSVSLSIAFLVVSAFTLVADALSRNKPIKSFFIFKMFQFVFLSTI